MLQHICLDKCIMHESTVIFLIGNTIQKDSTELTFSHAYGYNSI